MNPTLHAAFDLLATCGAYFAAKALYRRHPRPWLSPLLLAPATLLLLVSASSYAQYAHATHALAWMLGPATVAYAYPIHQRRGIIQRYPLTVGAGVLCGLTLGLATSWGLGHLFALPPQLQQSLLPRSVSTPFAIVASADFGGTPAITVLCVLATGFIGMLSGESVHAWLGLRTRLARGAAWGAAAHAIGCAAAYERGAEVGAVASLTMVISGVAMTLLAPALARLL
jgi:putative effector of murein hydrolase